MKKVVAVIVVVLVLAGAGGWYVLANKDSNKKNDSMDMPTSHNSSNQTATATNSVKINNFAFSPASITVKVGTKVTWTNKDSVAHTVTESDGQTGPASGDISNGSSYSFTFDTAGTYHYHCAIHPSMTGTVTVTN